MTVACVARWEGDYQGSMKHMASCKTEVLAEVADEYGHFEDEDGVTLRKHLQCWIAQLKNTPDV